jgi:hypothetical protein
VRPLDRTVVGPEPSPPERRARPKRGRGVLGALARLPVPMLAGVFLLGSLTGVGLTAVLRLLRDEPAAAPPIVVDDARDAIPPSAAPSERPAAPTATADAEGAAAAAPSASAADTAAAAAPTEAAIPEPGAAASAPSPGASTAPTPGADAAASAPTEATRGAAARARLDVVHPKNARVMIDGEARGKVPLLGLDLAPGRHELTLILKRSRREVVLDLEPGRRTVIDKDELRRLEAE